MTTLGRPRQFDRDEALEAAMQVFWRKGFLAASMNDLCEAMGIRSPSLYAAFGSKENLYNEAVERYNVAARTLIWGHIDDGPTMRAAMQKVLMAAAEVLPGSDAKPSGCLVALATGEEGAVGVPETGRLAREASLEMLRTGLRRAVASGELPKVTNVDRLGRFYLGVVHGMAIQARDGATSADLKALAKIAMSAWPAAAIG